MTTAQVQAGDVAYEVCIVSTLTKQNNVVCGCEGEVEVVVTSACGDAVEVAGAVKDPGVVTFQGLESSVGDAGADGDSCSVISNDRCSIINAGDTKATRSIPVAPVAREPETGNGPNWFDQLPVVAPTGLLPISCAPPA